MNLMDEMASGTCLLVSEQLSILSFEISRYQHDVDFLLPDIHEKLKVVVFVNKTLSSNLFLKVDQLFFFNNF